MASFTKIKKSGVGRVLLHNNRKEYDGVTHSNTEIDNKRTHLNYYLKEGTPQDVTKRVEEVFNIKRSDQVVLGEMIVTLPKDVKKNDEEKFFRSVYGFYQKDFGEKNIINAVVHKDEKTPHIHIDFVPVIKGVFQYPSERMNVALTKWRVNNGVKNEEDIERLSCKSLIDRLYLKSMHERLSEYVKRDLGYEVEILNGATANGNKTVTELKLKSLKAEISMLEHQKSSLQQEIINFQKDFERSYISKDNLGLLPLMNKIEETTRQNEILKQILLKENYAYTKDDINNLKKASAGLITLSENTNLNVLYGSLNQLEIPDNSITVIELGYKQRRQSPQQELISKNNDLLKLSLKAECEESPLVGYRIKKKEFLFLKTDNEEQTMKNLILLEQTLRNMNLYNKTILMEKIKTDKYNIAYQMLKKIDVKVQYYMNSRNYSEDLINDKIKTDERKM